MRAPCSVDDCDRTSQAKGLCDMHYHRWRRTGLTSFHHSKWAFMLQEDRFLASFTVGEHPDDCWLWTASLDTHGYGMVRFEGRSQLAHRVAYRYWIGPIPDGLPLDHTCHNGTGCPGGDGCIHRRCVNPAHLEAVTHRINSWRGNRTTDPVKIGAAR